MQWRPSSHHQESTHNPDEKYFYEITVSCWVPIIFGKHSWNEFHPSPEIHNTDALDKKKQFRHVRRPPKRCFCGDCFRVGKTQQKAENYDFSFRLRGDVEFTRRYPPFKLAHINSIIKRLREKYDSSNEPCPWRIKVHKTCGRDLLQLLLLKFPFWVDVRRDDDILIYK